MRTSETLTKFSTTGRAESRNTAHPTTRDLELSTYALREANTGRAAFVSGGIVIIHVQTVSLLTGPRDVLKAF